ncbi:VOC family protein [Tumebacillus lipolyticus]|uniref:VOC family protein n=1 Tax=Tumebacillus lipolyticus TaxID=1280370 RepID=A0ABW4ZW35_9BACL
MQRVMRFELQVDNPQAAIDFYADVFGWKFHQLEGHDYWFVSTGESGEGIDGAIMKSPDGVARTVNSIAVPSVDQFLAKIEERGGQVVVPKMTMPGMGYLAYCIDPEGTIFGVSQTDPEAK